VDLVSRMLSVPVHLYGNVKSLVARDSESRLHRPADSQVTRQRNQAGSRSAYCFGRAVNRSIVDDHYFIVGIMRCQLIEQQWSRPRLVVGGHDEENAGSASFRRGVLVLLNHARG